jgi:hypothetical protein
MAFKITCLSCGREVTFIQHPTMKNTIQASTLEITLGHFTVNYDGNTALKISCACSNEVEEVV